LAYIPETVMNCDDDYVNKPEKYICLGNTIDGNIFNKHNDQEKKILVKRIFANCILKYFENMMIDHSDSTILLGKYMQVLSISHKMADYFAFPLLL
jgi:hypothetical protein